MSTLYTQAIKHKKAIIVLVALVIIGAALMLSGRLSQSVAETSEARDILTAVADYIQQPPTNFKYEEAMEARLEEFFGLVEGAGRVRVMVSPLKGRETVFQVDVNETRSYTKEEDSGGGSREIRQYQSAQQTVMVTDRGGTDIPLVIRELEPRIEGIVIIAEGGDSPFVRDALTRAARAVLGLEAHMVQVLTMETK